MLLDNVIAFIIKKRVWIVSLFTTIVFICALLIPLVKVNYDLSEYLPEDAASKIGLTIMEEEFGYPGTARLMVGPVSLYEAKVIKDKVANLEGVDMVLWMDGTTDVYQSNLFIQYDDIDEYYKNEYAVMDITFVKGDSDKLTHKAISEIQSIVGEKGYMTGASVQNKSLSDTLTREISVAMVMGVFMIGFILCITTTSWFEPVMFLTVMGIAIIINMGTNIFLGTISFLTFSVAAILQLAIAMDYSIFLLHSFTREKKKGMDSESAIASALRQAISSILSSGATTIVGFIVLALMRFTIGKDMGIVLAKGIVISLLTVLILMPALILKWGDKIEKTAHRPFMPSFMPLGRFVYKVRYIVLGAVIFITIPCYAGQNMNNFLFGNDALGSSEGTKVYEDEQKINEHFGRSNLILAIVPNTNNVTEKRLSDEIEDLYYTKSVTSLSKTLPEGIPESFLPKNVTELLHTQNYARMMIYIKTANESDLAFQCTDEIEQIVKKYYPENAYVVGVTPSTQDIKNTITQDYKRVNIISLLGVAIVVMITFRSVIVPVVVMIPIEVAIFINMCVPYLAGEKMIFMGYIIVSCLQLGATIDYSILLTNNYLTAREDLSKKEAAITSVSNSALSILTSGVILTTVGYGLYFTSSVAAIAGIGRLIGRGALFSMALVLFLLPVLLMRSDKMIFDQKRRLDKMILHRRNQRKAHLKLVQEKLQNLKHMKNKNKEIAEK